MRVRTRIAPSPTGFLHVGLARTALFNYLFSRRENGEFLLRIEDTDLERSDKKFETDIINGLKWLGIDWDGEITRQSERLDIYEKYLKKLLDEDRAYLDGEAVRFKNPKKKIIFQDIIRGEIEIDTTDLGDFVVAKNIRSPLFHLAVVVDDAEMKITHVIRGGDHISNTPRQILVQEALGFERPIYAHLPLILGQDRSKLSKRHGATSVIEYREAGYLPEAMNNFLALLGWRPEGKGEGSEIYSKEELIKAFSLDHIQKSGAIFDIQKLDWMNGHYIRQKSPRELLAIIQNSKFKIQNDNAKFKNEYLEKVVALEQPRLKKLSELPEKIDYFFKDPEYDTSLLKWKNMDNNQIKSSLELAKELLQAVSENAFIKESLEKIFLERAEQMGDRGELLWPLRVALTGKKASPGPFEIMEVLGKDSSMSRLDRAIDKL